ncbi:MAG: signal peptide peptidase SppA [Verrucomicrobiota bacterium]
MDESNLPPASGVPLPPPPPQPPFAIPSAPPPPLSQSVRPVEPKSKKGRGWMIAAIILFLMLGFSVLMNFGQLVSGLGDVSGGQHHGAGPRLEEVTVKDSDGDDKIAVVPIEGVITSMRIDGTGYSMVDVVKSQLKRAEKDKHVQAVLLKVDSPGGEVLASDDIAKAIRKFQTDSSKPVIVSMGNLAASGGYYVSAPCRYIVANDLTITGSIGVIMSGLNYRGLMDKVGLRPQVFKSGKFKDMLSGSRDPDKIPQEELDMMQNMINEVYGRFTNVVATGRANAHKANKDDGKALAADWANFADGRVLTGNQALNLGLVDELGDFDATVEKAKDIANISSAKLVEYRRVSDLSELFKMFGKTEAKPLKVDIGIELPKLKVGQPYFLMDGYGN